MARIDPSQVDPDESATQLITAENPGQVAVLNPADNAENMGPAAPSTPAPAPDPEPSQSVADAFAAFAATQPVSAPRPAKAVDITTKFFSRKVSKFPILKFHCHFIYCVSTSVTICNFSDSLWKRLL